MEEDDIHLDEDEYGISPMDISPADEKVLLDISDIVAPPSRRALVFDDDDYDTIQQYLPPPAPLQLTRTLKIKTLTCLELEFFKSKGKRSKTVTHVANVLFCSGRYLVTFRPTNGDAENNGARHINPYIGDFKARDAVKTFDAVLDRWTFRDSKKLTVLESSIGDPQVPKSFIIFKIGTILKFAIEKQVFGNWARETEISYTGINGVDITIYVETRHRRVYIKKVELLVPFDFGNCTVCRNIAESICKCCRQPICSSECLEHLNHLQ